jgi:L-aspartate oxidase
MPSIHFERSDFLIIGTGLAGLHAALRLAERGSVHLVTKRALGESNTRYAQGGIAAALSPEDSIEAHVRDTLRAGAGLCSEEAVRSIVGDGPRTVADLIQSGVRFTQEAEHGLALGREGAHSYRRIAHVDDRTGHEIVRALIERVRTHPNIRVFENVLAVDIILQSRAHGDHGREVRADRCLGAFCLDRETLEVSPFLAAVTVLATGGVGKAYLYTTNPDIATGDGIAMAYRAGVRVANLEFVQFHPTCLYHPVARSFLITEACRGEGGKLTTIDGTAFMLKYDARAELATRDIVARAIDSELKERGDPYVLLHLEHLRPDRMRERFPHIYERCLQLGLDLTRQPLPVVPAAHYLCGGICTDLRARTDLPGLLAAGEVAHTGLHGANRLASNSLLEAAVMGGRAAQSAIEDAAGSPPVGTDPRWDPGGAVRVREAIILEHDWNSIRTLMWDHVGIVRSNERLEVARNRLVVIRETVETYFRKYLLGSDLVELRNLALVAELIVRCARERKESRGLHYNVDHPDSSEASRRDTILAKG